MNRLAKDLVIQNHNNRLLRKSAKKVSVDVFKDKTTAKPNPIGVCHEFGIESLIKTKKKRNQRN